MGNGNGQSLKNPCIRKNWLSDSNFIRNYEQSRTSTSINLGSMGSTSPGLFYFHVLHNFKSQIVERLGVSRQKKIFFFSLPTRAELFWQMKASLFHYSFILLHSCPVPPLGQVLHWLLGIQCLFSGKGCRLLREREK